MYEELWSNKFIPSKTYSDNDIESAIQKHEGISLAGFHSSDAFYALMHPILLKLKEPSEE